MHIRNVCICKQIRSLVQPFCTILLMTTTKMLCEYAYMATGMCPILAQGDTLN